MTSQCYCLEHSAERAIDQEGERARERERERERAITCTCWVFQQVVMCTDDVVM